MIEDLQKYDFDDTCRFCLTDLVTFLDFRTLMAKRHYTVDDLVDLFRGEIEDPRGFFTRVMAKERINAGTIIPYHCVLTWYFSEKHGQDLLKQAI
jgi:hypothetical protein